MGMLVGFEDARKAYVDTHPCVDSAFRFKFCYISISLVLFSVVPVKKLK